MSRVFLNKLKGSDYFEQLSSKKAASPPQKRTNAAMPNPAKYIACSNVRIKCIVYACMYGRMYNKKKLVLKAMPAYLLYIRYAGKINPYLAATIV